MARPKNGVIAPERDKATLRRQPVLFPPPREKSSDKDHGLLVRKGLGAGCGWLPKFQTAEEMEEAIQVYFDYVEEHDLPPTMAGLALALGFKSTKTLRNYEDKSEDFADIITIAKTRIEDWKNTALLKAEKQCQGIMFDLINHHEYISRFEQQRTTHDVSNSLADLLTQLQGNVLRPAPILEDKTDQIIDAEFSVPETTASESDIPEDLRDLV